MNRIRKYIEEPEESGYGDFYVVTGPFGRFAVTHEVARRIQRVLSRWILPIWIEFPDRVGSVVRVRTREIRSFVESTCEQRERDRVLDAAREREDKKPWE